MNASGVGGKNIKTAWHRPLLLLLTGLFLAVGLAPMAFAAKEVRAMATASVSSGDRESSKSATPNQVSADTLQADLYGVVLDIKKAKPDKKGALMTPMDVPQSVQNVTVRLETVPKWLGIKKDIVTVENVLGENPAYNIPLKPGTRVLLNLEKNTVTGKWNIYLANRNRTPALMILGTLLVMAILLIGGPEVSKHALLVTLMLIGCYKTFFPAIREGITGPNWIFLMCVMYTILGSFIYQPPGTKNFSREQSVMILSTFGGLLILTLIMWAMHELTPLDGFSSEALAGLWYDSPKMDYWSFYLGGILFGYQGFVFYLCWMLAQNRKDSEVLSFKQRFDIVMLRGRRLLGPMISSLGLLFLGLFMPILLQMEGTPTAQFVNLESTASMLTFAFAGGLTLILTVPLTALVAGWLLSSRKPEVVPTNETRS